MKNNPANIKAVSAAVYSLLALWFIFALVMGIRGQYVSGPHQPPRNLGLTLIVPMLILVAGYWRHGSLWAFAQTLDLKLVTLLHVSRIVGVVFLVEYAQGRLARGFALPAGLGDIITGLAAIPLALVMSHRTPGVGKWFLAWNIFGLADLIVAVGAGILNSTSSFGILAGDGPTTLLMSEFPLSLIPTFAVPVLMLLHLLAFSRAHEVGVSGGDPRIPHKAATA